MTHDTAVTGGRRPLKIGGVEYMASQLSDKDIAELDEWLRARFISMARDSLGPDCSQKQIDDTLAVAMRDAMGLTWMSGIGARVMASVDGVARLAWQMVHHSHPTVTYEEIRKHMYDPRNMANVNDAFDGLNVGEGKSFKKEREKKRKQLLRSRKVNSTARSRRGTDTRPTR